jgi:hypothetical protein
MHRCHALIQRPIRLLLDKPDDLLSVIIQPRAAPSNGFGLNCSRLAPILMPSHRAGDTNAKAFRCFPPGRPFLNRINNSSAQIQRTGTGHGSSRNRIKAKDSAIPLPLGIPIQRQRNPL